MLIPLLAALLATIVIELGVLFLLRERRKKVLWASVVVNCLTNIPLNIYMHNHDAGFTTLLLFELLIIVVEALWYLCFTRSIRLSVAYSVLCNAISFLTGVVVQIAYIIIFINP